MRYHALWIYCVRQNSVQWSREPLFEKKLHIAQMRRGLFSDRWASCIVFANR